MARDTRTHRRVIASTPCTLHVLISCAEPLTGPRGAIERVLDAVRCQNSSGIRSLAWSPHRSASEFSSAGAGAPRPPSSLSLSSAAPLLSQAGGPFSTPGLGFMGPRCYGGGGGGRREWPLLSPPSSPVLDLPCFQTHDLAVLPPTLRCWTCKNAGCLPQFGVEPCPSEAEGPRFSP